jgi:Uma2 family endonuclease
MGDAVPGRMTADEFIAWAMARPEGERYELVDGAAIAVAPERIEHTEAKGLVFLRLFAAIEAAGLPCRAYTDGVTVRVDDHTVYEPDVTVRCGPPLSPGTVVMTDPLVLVEVLSPAARGIDVGLKLSDYFRIPSLRHYLLVRADRRVVIHHRRDEEGAIMTSLLGDGPVRLDPPGVVVEGLFA